MKPLELIKQGQIDIIEKESRSTRGRRRVSTERSRRAAPRTSRPASRALRKWESRSTSRTVQNAADATSTADRNSTVSSPMLETY